LLGSAASRAADQSGFAASVIDAAARLSISHRATETTLVAADAVTIRTNPATTSEGYVSIGIPWC
jgi:hypothetical protein